MWLIERLAAGSRGPLSITVLEEGELGVGRVWRVDQPRSLIMNAVAVDSTAFIDESVTIEGERFDGPTFFEWCLAASARVPEAGFRDISAGRFAQLDPRAIVAAVTLTDAAAAIDEHTCAPRALYGCYLRWHARLVQASLPQDVVVRQVRATATDVVPDGDGWAVQTDARTITARSVVLAIGWGRGGDALIHQLPRVRSRETVRLRGLGLSFLDAVSLLSEHRGGRFVPAEHDDTGRVRRLRYEPSGLEPMVLAGSRLGVPFRAKPAWTGVPRIPSLPSLGAVARTWDSSEPGDFESVLWPAIERDALRAYYLALEEQTDAVLSPMHELEPVLLHSSVAERTAVLREAVPDARVRIEQIDRRFPLQDQHETEEQYSKLVLDYLRDDIDECLAGEPSPVKAMHLALNAARPALSRFVRFGGLTPPAYASYQQYMKLVGIIGCVPPHYRNQQLAALAEAGVVRFVRGESQNASATASIIDAWTPRPSPVRDDALLMRLHARGAARAYAVGDALTTDALEVSPADGTVVGSGGDQRGLFSVGIPSEDQRAQTIFAPIPDANSDVFHEIAATAAAVLTRASTRMTATQERKP